MLIHDLRNPCMNIQFGVSQSKKILGKNLAVINELRDSLVQSKFETIAEDILD